MMDVKIYVDTDADLRILRLVRDTKSEGAQWNQLLTNI